MLLEGADYKIRYVENLPSTVHCFVAEDGAGFFNIYVNANLTHDKIMVSVEHELEHMENNDTRSESSADQVEYFRHK